MIELTTNTSTADSRIGSHNDGIVTIIYLAALYATQTVGFTAREVTVMFIVLNVVAVIGALGFGRLADAIGQKRTISLSLLIWLAAVVIAYLSHSRQTFWMAATLCGLGMGSAQSVTRSLVALFTPKENAAEFFGFLGIAGKALAFLGPLVFGTLSRVTGSQRPAILAIGVFFVVGIVLLSFVDERKGKEVARLPVDQRA